MNQNEMQQPEPPTEDSDLMTFLGEIADRLDGIDTKLDTLLSMEKSEAEQESK